MTDASKNALVVLKVFADEHAVSFIARWRIR